MGLGFNIGSLLVRIGFWGIWGFLSNNYCIITPLPKAKNPCSNDEGPDLRAFRLMFLRLALEALVRRLGFGDSGFAA